MQINWLAVELVLIFVAVLAHLVIAYWIAPKKAKQYILFALKTDKTFIDDILANVDIPSLTQLVLSRIKPSDVSAITDNILDGLLAMSQDKEVTDKIKNMIYTWINDWFNSVKMAASKEINKNAAEQLQIASAGNPVLGIAMKFLPKNLYWLIQFLPLLMNGGMGGMGQQQLTQQQYDYLVAQQQAAAQQRGAVK
jgi:hypothetical protein